MQALRRGITSRRSDWCREAELDLGFTIGDMLAHDWIVLLKLQLGAGGLRILSRGVEVTRAGAGDELDNGAHELSLRVQQGSFHAELVDGA